MTRTRWIRVSLSLAALLEVAAVAVFAIFFGVGAVERSSRLEAQELAIWATAADRNTTYAAIRTAAGQCRGGVYPPNSEGFFGTSTHTTLAEVDRQVCEYQHPSVGSYPATAARRARPHG
jgi:hypothetical protein